MGFKRSWVQIPPARLVSETSPSAGRSKGDFIFELILHTQPLQILHSFWQFPLPVVTTPPEYPLQVYFFPATFARRRFSAARRPPVGSLGAKSSGSNT